MIILPDPLGARTGFTSVAARHLHTPSSMSHTGFGVAEGTFPATG